MARATTTTWRVDLRFRGALRAMGLRRVVVVGEGGDLVVPGIGDGRVLASETRVHAVPGLELSVGHEWHSIPDAGIELAPGEWVKLRVVAHPQIELVVGRERIEPVPISRMPIPPWREAVYGLAFAACMASLVSVKVAVSPVRDREEDDRVMAQELLDDVPIAFVMPPAFVEAPLPDHGDDAKSLDPADADDGNAEVVAVSEVAQLDPAAAPKPKPRKRRVPEEADSVSEMRVLGMLTSADSRSAGVFDVIDGENHLGELMAVAEASEMTQPTLVLREAPGVDVTDVIDAGPGIALPTEVARPADEDVEGVAASPTCELEYDAKDRIDIVFVVDASAPMAKVLWSLAERVPELHRTVADKQVRYGLVAFADEVELVRLDALTKDEVRVALLDLSTKAQEREPDADVRDDVLGALDRARTFAWGETRDTLRMMVLVTDNDYGDRGDHLGEHEVKESHAGVVDDLADDSIRVTTVTRRKVPGLDDGRDGHPSLPAATGGIALRESTLYPTDGLADAMRDLVRNPVCRKNIVDVLVE